MWQMAVRVLSPPFWPYHGSAYNGSFMQLLPPLSLCSLSPHPTSQYGQSAICKVLSVHMDWWLWWSGLPNASEKVPPCHCTQTIYYWMRSIHTHLEHVQCSAKGYLTLKCAGKYDEWWGLSDCVLKDFSHRDVLRKMMSKELLADLDANTWSLSLSRWAKWGENSMAVASAIETILILSWVCVRNHVVGLS
jgi:hypothetical protein